MYRLVGPGADLYIYYAVGTRFSGTLLRAAATTLPPLLHMCRYNVGLCVGMVRACVHFGFLARVGMVRACLHFAFLARVLTWCALHFAFLARAARSKYMEFFKTKHIILKLCS